MSTMTPSCHLKTLLVVVSLSVTLKVRSGSGGRGGTCFFTFRKQSTTLRYYEDILLLCFFYFQARLYFYRKYRRATLYDKTTEKTFDSFYNMSLSS